MLLRRMQGFRLNIHAPGCSPSTWHLEAQAEELRDVVACATPAVDLHTYSVRTQQVPSLVATGIIYITPAAGTDQMFKFALAVEQIQQVRMPATWAVMKVQA